MIFSYPKSTACPAENKKWLCKNEDWLGKKDGTRKGAILVPKNKYGAGYINDISHHHLNKIGNEYEVVLQNNSEYGIIKAQYFNKKLFLVVEWRGERKI